QDSFNTIQGLEQYQPKPAAYAGADTLRVAISGFPGNYTDAPQLDTAFFTMGIPTSDMNCKGSAGCWLYAGPQQFVSLSQGLSSRINLGQPASSSYVSPTLPAGTYTFQLKLVQGDLDLYVKANGIAQLNSWDCRP